MSTRQSLFCVILILLFTLTSCLAKDYYYVKRVVDGDTILLDSGEKVRLIGIDTPESRVSKKLHKDAERTGRDIKTIQELGKKAFNFAKKLMEGKKVRLEYDIDKKDRYGRLLAYVFLKDGTFINAKLIEEGYAQVYTFPPNVKYVDLFTRLQKEAREDNKGLWKLEK